MMIKGIKQNFTGTRNDRYRRYYPYLRSSVNPIGGDNDVRMTTEYDNWVADCWKGHLGSVRPNR